jgi:hypothetical protein
MDKLEIVSVSSSLGDNSIGRLLWVAATSAAASSLLTYAVFKHYNSRSRQGVDVFSKKANAVRGAITPVNDAGGHNSNSVAPSWNLTARRDPYDPSARTG